MLLAVAAAWAFPQDTGTQSTGLRDTGSHITGSTDSSTTLTIAATKAQAPTARLSWTELPAPEAPQASPAARRVDCSQERCVALTFDDGPGPHTKRLLRILEQYDARATFFLVGKMVHAHPWVARRIADAGHEVGVHSWSHPDLRNLTAQQVRAQLVRTRRIIEQTTGDRPVLSRPPYGASSERVRAEHRRADLAEILWTVDPTDWKHRNARVVRRSVERDLRRNSIVLLHDIRPTTVDAIPALLRHLERRRITLVTVSELLGETQPGVTYGRPDWSPQMQRDLR
ncbi:peptidoglycan/xylan/chitin deacetylase (PgdA/CDA1 family) [Nocardioides daedukensis]|uniref:Peptidoglycan/xylan/chitin deacetylase (PgdA/CDA1 family) n=1 Tax=Nocardioides daedukensis TaxID=634462 RepID=A0A7Y9UPG2_9ACTN|nr:polysaccharide deacetylase family protein [Nocardioides daedukensis]NYG59578.1 peptidoglycan/xylan/chitin deacetylase (PgdA/CDA1 family) [Nocardioides daedukensis]